jgi:N6-adenosine-specific RNA methylase IME4
VIKYRTILAIHHGLRSSKADEALRLITASYPPRRLPDYPSGNWQRMMRICGMWVTNSALDEQVGVMEAWGFEYRAALTWIKPYIRLGNYLRHQTEHLLFGTRGRLPIQFRSQGTWFYAPLQDHSHKPKEQYAIIERCSPGPRIELFARRRQPGWDAIGNEIDGRDIRDVLHDYADGEPA